MLEECGETLSTPEAAAVLGLSQALARGMIRRRQINALECGRIYRIPRRSIEKMLDGSEE
jgi:excisionase family DNA binding protein